MTFWRLRADDPTFGLNRGDILEGEVYWDNPGGFHNPEGKVRIVRRLRDDYRPACTMDWVQLDQLDHADASVRQALLEGTKAMVRDPHLDARPSITVLAATAADAQREIADLHLGEMFTPYYVSHPNALRGCQRFIVMDSFADRVERAAVAQQWEDNLFHLRDERNTVREFTPDDIRRAAQVKRA